MRAIWEGLDAKEDLRACASMGLWLDPPGVADPPEIANPPDLPNSDSDPPIIGDPLCARSTTVELHM